MEKVGAVELLAVGLAHCDDVLLSFEDLNLEVTVNKILEIKH